MASSSRLRQFASGISNALQFNRLTSKQHGIALAMLSVPVVYACWRLDPLRLSGEQLIQFDLFFIVSILIGLFPVRVSSEHISLSPQIPIVMATLYVYGAFAAVLQAVTGILIAAIWLDRKLLFEPTQRRRVFWSCVHNVPHVVFSAGLPAVVFATMVHAHWFAKHSPTSAGLLCVSSVADFYISAALMTILVAKWYKMRWDVVWYNNYRWTLASTVLLSPLGFLMGVLTEQSVYLGLGFIIIPLAAIHQGYALHERRMATYREGVELLGRLMQESHPYTHGHLNRVARWAVKIAEGLQLPAESMTHMQNAAVLHDIGKIALDDRILNKIEKLTDEEWAKIKDHPVVGAEIASRMQYLGQVSYWIRHHHERIDGKGYPDGLVDQQIPVESKIICVVDAFDAMVGGPSKSDQRPYREPKTMEEARAELVRCSNTQFDEKVVQCFLKVLDAEEDEARKLRDAEIGTPLLVLVSPNSQTSKPINQPGGQIRLKGAA